MDLPPREALLDIDWLEREHADHGVKGLEVCLRRGAERYGGAVTAVADAALSFDAHVCHRLQDGTDFRHFLAHRLLAGSWSSAAEGPGPHRREAGMSYMMATASRERREAFWAKAETRGYSPAAPPALPPLPELRLIPSVEGAWVQAPGPNELRIEQAVQRPHPGFIECLCEAPIGDSHGEVAGAGEAGSRVADFSKAPHLATFTR